MLEFKPRPSEIQNRSQGSIYTRYGINRHRSLSQWLSWLAAPTFILKIWVWFMALRDVCIFQDFWLSLQFLWCCTSSWPDGDRCLKVKKKVCKTALITALQTPSTLGCLHTDSNTNILASNCLKISARRPQHISNQEWVNDCMQRIQKWDGIYIVGLKEPK